MATARTDLTQPQMRTLELAATYGVITVLAVHRQIIPDKSYAAAKSLIRRLCGRGPRYRYLRPEDLGAKRVYYRLTKRGTETLGVSIGLARSFGPLARIDRFARLWFMCVEDSEQRSPMDPRNFSDRFNGIRQVGIQLYVAECADGPKLGFSLVDHGRSLDNLQRRACRFLSTHLEAGWLQQFLADGNFELSLLTISPEKQQSLDAELPRRIRRGMGRRFLPFEKDHGASLPFSLRTWVVPHLMEILPEIRTERKNNV